MSNSTEEAPSGLDTLIDRNRRLIILVRIAPGLLPVIERLAVFAAMPLFKWKALHHRIKKAEPFLTLPIMLNR